MNLQNIIDNLSLNNNAKLFGSAASGKLENITDIDVNEYLLIDKTNNKKYTKKLQEIIKKDIPNVKFIKFEGGINKEFLYPFEFDTELEKFNIKDFQKWVKTIKLKEEDKKKINDLIKNEKHNKCLAIKLREILRPYKNIIWTKKDIEKGFVVTNKKKIYLHDIFLQHNVNIKSKYIILYLDNFYELEVSYTPYFIKNGKKILYNQTEGDYIFNMYKFFCLEKYLKVLKRLRSMLTRINFTSKNNNTLNYFELEIRNKFKFNNHNKKILWEVRKEIGEEVHSKFNEENSRLAKLKVLKYILKNKLYNKFGLTKKQFETKYIKNTDLDSEILKLQTKLKEEGKKLIPKYMNFAKHKLNLLHNLS